MNRTRIIAMVCGAAFTALLGGCGGGSSSSGTIGGTVAGLSGTTQLSLSLNGGTPISVANGNFTFSGGLASGAGYNVVVVTQPAGQTCLVANGSGTIDYSGNSVTNVAVNCTANVQISTSVSGLKAGNTVTFALTLQNDPQNSTSTTATGVAGSPSSVVTANFTNLLPIGTLYGVTVSTQPGGNTKPVQICTATGTNYSGGVITSAPIVVAFNCQ